MFRTGAWYDWAYTDRYQFPSNILTPGGYAARQLPRAFHHAVRSSRSPSSNGMRCPKLVITAGIKAADYNMALNQYQDNGKTVGCLGGTLSTYPSTYGIWAGAPDCIGGAAFVTHSINYNNWLPTLTARYRVWRQWSVYAQFAEGSIIPPSAVFDVPGGNVLIAAEAYACQDLSDRLGAEAQPLDAGCGRLLRSLPERLRLLHRSDYARTGVRRDRPLQYQGHRGRKQLRARLWLQLLRQRLGRLGEVPGGPNYPNGGEWVANTPSNVEGFSLLWQHRNFDVGLTYKRVGQYYNDNGSLSYKINGISIPYPVDQAITINPFSLTNAVPELHGQERFTPPRDQDPAGFQQSVQQPQSRRDYSGDGGHRYGSFRAEPGRSAQPVAGPQHLDHHYRRVRTQTVGKIGMWS